MDRAMLQRVSDRWSDYGFDGSSPVAGMINRLTRPEAPAKKAKPGAQ
jgi:4-hydroxy-3-polyprenylbenzoate decarboxylase